jgi:hypothetical protein
MVAPEDSFQHRLRGAFRRTLKPPETNLLVSGDVVLLRDENYSSEGLNLKAYLVSERDIAGMLFCHFAAHKMDMYLGLCSEFLKGNINRTAPR